MAGDLTQAENNIDKVHAIVHAADGKAGFDTLVTGTASINSDFSHTAQTDLRKGEGIGVPIALIILLLVFGAVVAAGLPILLSLLAITLAVGLTALVGQTFSVSVFAINMISMMGLATGIDYSLFIISRFREERARGRDKLDAIAVTGGTASRAVLFSGLTVVLALLGLLIVPTNIFASLAIGAILVVSMSVLAALTLLPAVLGLLGDRVNSLKLPYLGRRIIDNRAAGRTSWIARVAYRAMKRPALALVIGIAVLLVLAYPALDMKTGVSGVNSFPNSFQSKQGFAVLEKQFTSGTVNPVQIVVDGNVTTPAVKAAMTGLTQELANDPAFGPVQVQTDKAGNLALLSVPVNGDPTGSLALNKVRELRGTLIPKAFDGSGASVYVTGQTAGNLDYINIVNSYFPWVVALVLSLSFVLLLVAFRSVVIPLKAILMNLLSVGAAYGLITLVSLKGWGASLLGFQQVPVVEQWVPLLLFAVLFGLSMDYQVFLLEPHQGGLGQDRRQHAGRHRGHRRDRRHHHRRRADHGGRVRRLRLRPAGDVPADGLRPRGRRAPRRDADPHHPGAVGHEAARPLELVPAELARVAAAPEHRGLSGRSGAHSASAPAQAARRPRSRAHPCRGARGLTQRKPAGSAPGRARRRGRARPSPRPRARQSVSARRVRRRLRASRASARRAAPIRASAAPVTIA